MSVSLKSYAGSSTNRDMLNVYDHIVDPNERRRLLLAEIDRSPLGWYHVRAVIVAGAGFFTDAYDIFAINLATAMLGVVFWQTSDKGEMPTSSQTAIKVAISAGAIIGNVVFGYLADWLGRKRMYGVELMIILTTTLAQTLSASSTALSVVGVLVFWRVIMGIGIGGDYPLSAVITSEFANTKWRGGMIAAVFAMQGFGQFAAAIVGLIVTASFKSSLQPVLKVSECTGECQKSVDIMWRILIGFGGIPGWFALYYRLTIPETPRYTFDVKHDIEKATADTRAFNSGAYGEGPIDPMRRVQIQQDIKSKYHTSQPTWKDFIRYFSQREHALALFGTAGSWFCLDIAFYGLGLNTSTVLNTIGFGGDQNVYDLFYNAAVGNLILICAGAIPGYWCTVLTVDILGRKTIQISGFVILTMLFAVIGFDFHGLSERALLALYVLCQFFFNFGPNATTFILPGEVFPTRFRATAHGISAATGKLGAIIAQVVFAPMAKRGHNSHSTSSSPWLNHVMQIFALFMLCGIGTTLLIPEPRRRTLERLAGESDDTEMFELNFVERFFIFDCDKSNKLRPNNGRNWWGSRWWGRNGSSGLTRGNGLRSHTRIRTLDDGAVIPGRNGSYFERRPYPVALPRKS